MKRLIITLFFLLHTPVFSAFVPTAHADLAYQTWYCPTWPCPTTSNTILSSGTLNTTLNYDWGGGNVLDSGRSDYVVVHLTGNFIMPGTVGQSYQVYFLNQDDDGSRLKIGNTVVIEDWSGLHGPANRGGGIVLVGGQTYAYERWFSEWGGGAVMRQLWQIYGIHGSYVWMNAGTDFTSLSASAAPQYVSNISTAQQARVDSYRARSYVDASIHIDQIGNNNTVVIDQAGRGTIKGIGQQDAKIQGNYNNITIRQGVTTDPGSNEINLRVVGDTNTLNLNQARTTQGTAIGTNGHYLSTDINGSGNTLTTQQTNAGGVGGHYMETTIAGNTNNVTAKQTDNGNKLMFVTVNGSSNSVNAVQKDSGQHYLDLKLTGNNHSVSSVQQGNTQNKATIELINNGGGASIDMIQNGGAIYNITTTCVTAGGCAPITVRQ